MAAQRRNIKIVIRDYYAGVTVGVSLSVHEGGKISRC
jgi:hypothetical protein